MSDEPAPRAAVGERVRACLAQCVGAGGHLYGYTIDLETFELTDTTATNGPTRYAFRAVGRRDDEFTEAGYAGRESIEGTIVLDRDLGLTFDVGGRVQLDPHTPVHPRFWNQIPEWADPEAFDPPGDGLLELEVPELAAGAYNPVWWRPAEQDGVVAEVERLLERWGEAVVLVDDDGPDDGRAAFARAVDDVARAVETGHDLDVVDGELQTIRGVFRRLEGEET